jgi:quercetin dioxygenase-like cupin family protein
MPRPAHDPDIRSNLFGGQGDVHVWDLAPGRDIEPFTAVLHCELEPGSSVGAHRQEHYSEIVVGVEGTGEARVGEHTHSLGAHDVVHLPRGETLALRNLSADEPLRYLIIKARPG